MPPCRRVLCMDFRQRRAELFYGQADLIHFVSALSEHKALAP